MLVGLSFLGGVFLRRRIISVALVFSLLLLTALFYGCETDVSSDQTDASSDRTGVDRPLVINHTVIFDTNGGSAVEKKKVDKITKAPVTTRDGYLFNGWFLDESFDNAAIFPLQVEDDMTLYARWLKIKDEATCAGCVIKWDSDLSSSATYYITPSGFDLEELQRKGCASISIDVSYDVYYKKDYDVLWDIGYMGAPKYEVYIINSEGRGKMEEDIKATTSTRTGNIGITVRLSDLETNSFKLVFSTNNVQNKIYFKNIVVTYTCNV